MNYRVQLVVGDGAAFFLEEWPAGGVEILPDVVGLFEVPPVRADRHAFEEQLEMYGLGRAAFGLKELLRIGLSSEWRWQGAAWSTTGEPRLAGETSKRLQALLQRGDPCNDQEVQLNALRIMQAAERRLGTPLTIHGEWRRESGRVERLLVFRTGIVAYDRTPHPLPFLRRVAEIVKLWVGGPDSPDAASRGR